MKKILIIGRTASGKSTLSNELKKLNLKELQSYTTRPRRHENEQGHIFITQDEADELIDRIAETKINGYEYFATRSMYDECDFYVIDPKGYFDLKQNTDDNFHVIYITADRVSRKRASKLRGDKNFCDRDKSENKMFNKFENDLKDIQGNGDTFTLLVNTYEEDYLKAIAKKIKYLYENK